EHRNRTADRDDERRDGEYDQPRLSHERWQRHARSCNVRYTIVATIISADVWWRGARVAAPRATDAVDADERPGAHVAASAGARRRIAQELGVGAAGIRSGA